MSFDLGGAIGAGAIITGIDLHIDVAPLYNPTGYIDINESAPFSVTSCTWASRPAEETYLQHFSETLVGWQTISAGSIFLSIAQANYNTDGHLYLVFTQWEHAPYDSDTWTMYPHEHPGNSNTNYPYVVVTYAYPPPLTITSSPIPDAHVGSPYSYHLTANYGVTWRGINSINLTPTADALVSCASDYQNYNYGQYDTNYVSSGGYNYRTYMRWNVTSIPNGTLILGAYLWTCRYDSGAAVTVNVHQGNATDWAEGTTGYVPPVSGICWNNQPGYLEDNFTNVSIPSGQNKWNNLSGSTHSDFTSIVASQINAYHKVYLVLTNSVPAYYVFWSKENDGAHSQYIPKLQLVWGLPSWLSLNPSTGDLTGTPTVAGTYTVNILATRTDGLGVAWQNFTIAVDMTARNININAYCSYNSQTHYAAGYWYVYASAGKQCGYLAFNIAGQIGTGHVITNISFHVRKTYDTLVNHNGLLDLWSSSTYTWDNHDGVWHDGPGENPTLISKLVQFSPGSALNSWAAISGDTFTADANAQYQATGWDYIAIDGEDLGAINGSWGADTIDMSSQTDVPYLDITYEPTQDHMPPIASFTESMSWNVVSVDASASRDQNVPPLELTYTWDFGDGSKGSGATASHTYAVSGTYVISLTVTNTIPLSAIVARSVEAVVPYPPVARFIVTMSSSNASVNASESSDPWGLELTYVWDFGDGSKGSGVTATHTYAANGTYVITLTVTNTVPLCSSANESVTATIVPPPPPPPPITYFCLNLSQGWNFVTVPPIASGYKASTLGLAAYEVVASYDPLTQTYKTYIVGLPVNDFDITPSTGYWINALSAKTLTLPGTIPTATQTRTIIVPNGGGWAIIGFNSLKTSWHARDITSMYSVPGAITMVASWNPVTKAYTTWLSVIPTVNNFVLVPGQAYWILCSMTGTLSYAP